MSEAPVSAASFGLTALQSGMLFQALLDEDHGASSGFNIQQAVIAVPEPVPLRTLRDSWRRVAARHPVLRTSFDWEQQARPVLRVHPDVPEVEIEERAWPALPGEEQRARLLELLAEDRRRGFDLRRAPLDRFLVLRTGPASVEIVWTYHHILKDGRSFHLLLDELLRTVRALRDGRDLELDPPPTPFTEFSAWTARHDTSRSAGYFRELLRGRPSPTRLPGAERAPLAASGTGIESVFLGTETSHALRTLARDSATTLGSVVQSAWSLLLARWTGEDDVLFGSTRACRKSALEGRTAEMVGMFINTLPLRVDCRGERSLRELLADLRAQSLALREHEHTPIVDVQLQSEMRRGAPLFETVVMFENHGLRRGMQALDPWWSRCSIELFEQPVPPLVLTAFGGTELQLRLLYDRRRFLPSTVERMLAHLVALLTRMGEHLDRPLGELECVPADERARSLFGWNDTRRAFRDDLCIHELFEQQVERRPDAVALLCEGESLTFRELEERANRIANALIARGAGPGSYVAFQLERGFDLVATMIGIAKSGAAYVPVDPGLPPARARFMVEDTRARLVVSEPPFAEHFAGVETLLVGTSAFAAAASGRPPRRSSPRDVCYAIYTSGSTGVPKGVVLTHRAVVNTLEWVSRTFGVGPADRLLFVTSPGFDLSVYDVFGALGAGASVEIAASGTLAEPALLAGKLVQPGVTIWNSAPTMLSQLVPFLPAKAAASRLRLALLSGDWIPVRLPGELRAVFPLVEPKSLGGATEAAIWSNFHEIGAVDPAWRSIPYGRPIQNARYYLLDRRLQPVPSGVAGDLYIGGTCLAEGYLGRPELTAERFLADPFVPGERIYRTGDLARCSGDGIFEFLGRADFQVKVRGFRVELGEVEAALLEQPGVRECVCTTRVDASGEKSIVAHAVARDGVELRPEALRKALLGTLPAYMVPSSVAIHERLPLTSSGKLDRAALAESAPPARSAAGAAARTPFEQELVALWEDVLETRPIGIHDDFFELGGHSLLAVLLVSRAGRELGLQLPLSALLATPTIASLAESLGGRASEARLRAVQGGPLVELHRGGNRPPLYIVAGIGGEVFNFRELARRLGPDQPVFAFTSDRADQGSRPPQTVEQIAASYLEAIEARGAPCSTPIFAGYSFGALVAFELARRFRASGRKVGRLIVFDGFAPGFPEHMPLFQRAWAHIKELRRRDGRGRLRYALERAENLRRRALLAAGLGRLLAPQVEESGDPAEERRRQVWARAMQAQAAYRPTVREEGSLLLFAAETAIHWPATRMDDPALGWGRWVRGRVDLVRLKGAHLDVFGAGNVECLAREVRRAIDEVMSRPPASR